MRKLARVWILCMGLFCSLTGFAQQQKTQSTDQFVQTQMRAIMRKDNIPGAAVVLYKNGKMHTYYFGYANLRAKAPVNGNTIFELGSITKTFTSLLLAEKVAAGTMHLHDSAAAKSQLPSSYNFKKITWLELATHTSSLPYDAASLSYNASATEKNRAYFRRLLQTWVAHYPPGTKILYSNFGFGVLGELLSQSAHASLPFLMYRNILNPLGMRMSGLDLSPWTQKFLAQGYKGDGSLARSLPSGLLGGAWSMKASANDMQLYLKAAIGLPGIPAYIQRGMHISQTAYYRLPQKHFLQGLGWTIVPLNGAMCHVKLAHSAVRYKFIPLAVQKISSPHFIPNAIIAKTGSTAGFRSYIAVIPSKKTGIVIMINRDIFAGGDIQYIGNKILSQVNS